MYDEYGEVIMEDDGYYYSPHGPEVLLPFLTIMSALALISCVSIELLKKLNQPCVLFQNCLYHHIKLLN